MAKRKYVVTEREAAPVRSHRGFFFPEWLYTLQRQEDGSVFRITLSKSLGWKPGDIVEVEDLILGTQSL